MQNDNPIVKNDRSFVKKARQKLPPARPTSHALAERLVQQGLEQVLGLAQRLALGDSQVFVAFD